MEEPKEHGAEKMEFSVNEIFNSISGEINGFDGIGQMSTFIRFNGCNLECRWCDTINAQRKMDKNMTMAQLLNAADLPHVTLTGGEPLLQDIQSLTEILIELNHQVTIETNGTLARPRDLDPAVICIMDYKLPSSQMTRQMELSAFQSLLTTDWIKFVCKDKYDLNYAYNFVNNWPCGTRNFAFSPIIEHQDYHAPWIIELINSIQKCACTSCDRLHFSLQLHTLLGVR